MLYVNTYEDCVQNVSSDTFVAKDVGRQKPNTEL